MTSLEDTVAGVLASPREAAARACLVDRVAEECADPRGELLRLVVAHHAGDGPRLAYADYCELQGEPNRAEFIRAQVRAAELESLLCRIPTGNFVQRTPLVAEMTRATRRANELLTEIRSPGERPWHGGGKFWRHVRATWSRGFIVAVELESKHWLAHGDAILERQPVRDVRLSTPPGVTFGDIREEESPDFDNGPGGMRLRATWTVRVPGEPPPGRVGGLEMTIREEELLDSRDAGARRERFRAMAAASRTDLGYLATRWPGVAFHLPPARADPAVETCWGVGPIAPGDPVERADDHPLAVGRSAVTVRRMTAGAGNLIYGRAETGVTLAGDVRVRRSDFAASYAANYAASELTRRQFEEALRDYRRRMGLPEGGGG